MRGETRLEAFDVSTAAVVNGILKVNSLP